MKNLTNSLGKVILPMIFTGMFAYAGYCQERIIDNLERSREVCRDAARFIKQKGKFDRGSYWYFETNKGGNEKYAVLSRNEKDRYAWDLTFYSYSDYRRELKIIDKKADALDLEDSYNYTGNSPDKIIKKTEEIFGTNDLYAFKLMEMMHDANFEEYGKMDVLDWEK